MSRYLYYFDLHVSGYICTVRLNGYALQFESAEPRLEMHQVNPWIISGENTIEVEVLASLGGAGGAGDAAASHDEDEPEPPGVMVKLSVETDPVDFQLGEGKVEVLAEMALDGSDIEGDDAQELPGVFSVAFNYQSPLGTWLWQQGEPLTDDDDDGAALANLVAGVHGMAEERDADGIIELMSIVIDERATAFGVPRAVVLEQLRGCYQDLFAEEDFAVAPLDGDNFAPRLHCDNRLLELVQSSGEPTIRQTDESDDVWGLPLLLGKIDGEWTVLSM